MNSTQERLARVFREHLRLGDDAPVTELAYNQTAGWDSLAHMTLVAAIEDEFGIMMETDDVIDMSSFFKAAEIVNKYSDAA
jgi:acyl carrier protein